MFGLGDAGAKFTSDIPDQDYESEQTRVLCGSTNNLARIVLQHNQAKGFWDNERNVGEMLMLVTSELGEAMEAHRSGRFADIEKANANIQQGGDWGENFRLHVKDTFEDEIADAIIRLFDLAAGLGIDLKTHIYAKMMYNQHYRERLHGKKY